jgi:ATP-dependent RNA helicase SUPV3L1/SUV3
LLQAWENRDAAAIPTAQALGKGVSPALRGQWEKSLAQASGAVKPELLLRLEMAAEVPTPAAHLTERRAMQLQLLTQRHAEPPAKTWGTDVATVLASPFDAAAAQRLRTALKALLK